MRAILAVSLLLMGCAKSGPVVVHPISFYDTAGVLHSVGRGKKPALLVFWITNCGYCTNTMGILDQARPRFPEDKLDVVGIYLNTASAREVAGFAQDEGHKVPVAASRESGQALLESFIAAFGFNAPGRHVYFVDGQGKVQALGSYPEVVQAVELATGLKPVEPAPLKPLAYSTARP